MGFSVLIGCNSVCTCDTHHLALNHKECTDKNIYLTNKKATLTAELDAACTMEDKSWCKMEELFVLLQQQRAVLTVGYIGHGNSHRVYMSVNAEVDTCLSRLKAI